MAPTDRNLEALIKDFAANLHVTSQLLPRLEVQLEAQQRDLDDMCDQMRELRLNNNALMTKVAVMDQVIAAQQAAIAEQSRQAAENHRNLTQNKWSLVFVLLTGAITFAITWWQLAHSK